MCAKSVDLRKVANLFNNNVIVPVVGKQDSLWEKRESIYFMNILLIYNFGKPAFQILFIMK